MWIFISTLALGSANIRNSLSPLSTHMPRSNSSSWDLNTNCFFFYANSGQNKKSVQAVIEIWPFEICHNSKEAC